MTDLLNLRVDLDEARFRDEHIAQAHRRIDALGLRFHAAADERALAWIDDEFGGWWSSEVLASQALVVCVDDAPIGFVAFEPRAARLAWMHGEAREPGVGIFGPLGISAGWRGHGLGGALALLALAALRSRGHVRALIPAVGETTAPWYERHFGASIVERFKRRALLGAPLRTVMLASGSGTNAQAVIDAVVAGELPLDLAALIANRSEAFALTRAQRAGIPAIQAVWQSGSETRAQYDAHMLALVRAQEPQLVLLLGWMHLLAPAFVQSFECVNVHPAFLPLDAGHNSVTLPDGTVMSAFRGLHALADALAAKSAWVGASVHRATEQTDRGTILARRPLRVGEHETHDEVFERLHPLEHQLLLTAIRRTLYER